MVKALKSKLINIPKNAQICLDRSFAGKEARVEYISESQALVTIGAFVPDHMQTFYTQESINKLEAFGEYEKTDPLEESLEELKAKVDGKK